MRTPDLEAFGVSTVEKYPVPAMAHATRPEQRGASMPCDWDVRAWRIALPMRVSRTFRRAVGLRAALGRSMQIPKELLRLRDVSLAELREKHTELHAKARELWSSKAGETLETLLVDQPKEVRKALKRIDLGDIFDTVQMLRTRLEEHLAGSKLSSDAQSAAREWLVGSEGQLPSLDANAPIGSLPELAPLFDRAELELVFEAAKLAGTEAKAVHGVAPSTRALDDRALRELVETKRVSADAAARLGVHLTMTRIAGNAELGTQLAEAAGEVPLRELARWNPDAWEKALSQANVGSAPDRARLAKNASETLARAFPSVALGAELTRQSPANGDLKAWTDAARLYPGLGLDAIASGSDPADAKASAIASRVGEVQAALSALPDLKTARLDAALVQNALPQLAEDVRPALLSTLQSYQRVLRVSNDPQATVSLLKAGYTSAMRIAADSTRQIAGATALDRPRAAELKETAKRVASRVTMPYWMLGDIAAKGPVVTYAPPGTADYLRRLSGWHEIFGEGAPCACEHCRSVLSPAAYFVDLMQLVDERISKVNPLVQDDGALHPLHLKARRPDLWTLELSCENTNDDVAYLEIINRVLASYIARSRGLDTPHTDARVRSFVFGQVLPNEISSPQQPFERAHHAAEVALSAFGLSRGELARALDGHWRYGLSVTALEEQILEGTIEVDLAAVMDLPVSIPAEGPIESFDVSHLAVATGLSRAEIEEALATVFVSAEGRETVTFEASKRSVQSVQNDIERIVGLTKSILDRLHRFVRMWRKTRWSIRELDLLIERGTAIGVAFLASIARTQARLELDVESMYVITGGPLPSRAATRGDAPPGERLFVVGDSHDPVLPGAMEYLHPQHDPDAKGINPELTARLRAGLGVDEPGLLALITLLAPTLRRDPSDGARPVLTLHSDTLGRLLSHARIAQALGLTMPELVRALTLWGGPKYLRDLSDSDQFIEWIDWLRASGYSLDEVEAILDGGVETVDDERAARVVELAAAQGRLSFADTVFAVVPEITEAGSRAIIENNAARFVAVGEGFYRLADGFDFTAALVRPTELEEAAFDERALLATLARYAPRNVFLALVAQELKCESRNLNEWLAWLGVEPDAALFADKTALAKVFARLRRLQSAARDLGAEELALVTAYRTAFSVGARGELGASSLRAFDRLRSLGGEASAWKLLLEVGQSRRAALASILETDEKTAAELDMLSRRTDLLAAVEQMRELFALAVKLGVRPAALADLVSDEYAKLNGAAEHLWAGLEKTAEGKAALDRLHGRERDALADYLVRALRIGSQNLPPFESANDLYAYFLLNVELDGCARTTPLAAAISSLQLYIQRCRMSLEQDRRPTSDRSHLRVVARDLDDGEWAWRRSYRLWEANRKVFLHPENYLEPALRDDKTQLFQTLEDELLQARDIDEQAVLNAYSNYLAGFEEVATLSIAGSYYDEAADVLHLFGCTSSDPPVYYYRSAQNVARAEVPASGAGVVWGNWRRVDIQIPSRKVSAVVYDNRLVVFWVTIHTRPDTKFIEGRVDFLGYRHTLAIHYSLLRNDGNWTAPQKISAYGLSPFQGEGVIVDDFPMGGSVPRYAGGQSHREGPIEGYTLGGFRWERVYPDLGPIVRGAPDALHVVGADFVLKAAVDLRKRRLVARNAATTMMSRPTVAQQRFTSRWNDGLSGRSGDIVLVQRAFSSVHDPFAAASNSINLRVPFGIEWWFGVEKRLVNVGASRPELEAVAGTSQPAALITTSSGITLFLSSIGREPGSYVLRRFNTSLADELRARLFDGGVAALLDSETQSELSEPSTGIDTSVHVEDRTAAGARDWSGPFAVYWREIFLHIPFLLATHLSSQGRFEAAQRWFHFLFDPTAEDAAVTGTDAEREKVWRYLGFRGLTPTRMLEQLTDSEALAAYLRDPFNPHAIARLRPVAYAKAVFLRYVENLIDWGDSLFAKFTRESVNEATLLYVLAQDLLGKKALTIPSCGEGGVSPRDYETIAPLLDRADELLAQQETRVTNELVDGVPPQQVYVLETKVAPPPTVGPVLRDTSWTQTRIRTFELDGQARDALLGPTTQIGSMLAGLACQTNLAIANDTAPTAPATPVFCVPSSNAIDELRARVEDRLYKIRHCRDIDGELRVLEPFGAPIDPMLIMEARAAGISLDEVLGADSGRVPPYRFSFLIERAKGHASVVAGVGAAMLAALEKKDGEELARLRLLHQRNLLALSEQVRDDEVLAANHTIESLERRRESIVYRRDFYQQLLTEGLSGSERAAQSQRGVALDLRDASITLTTASAVAHLLMQLGAVTAMKWGGVELGSSFGQFANVLGGLAGQAEAKAGASSTLASYERRAESWQHQRMLAEQELAQIEQDLAVARLRLRIAERSRRLHDESVAQADELFERHKEKFAGLGLFTFMSTQLSRLHRNAFDAAFSLARLAERALHYERGKDAPRLRGDYWGDWAGILAGERLLFDLNRLESWFVETHHRKLEVDQTFSLSQIAPNALWNLKETGECFFEVPELFFNLAYPGQYDRRIRAVRLTISAVVGPHLNIGATLELLDSKIRRIPNAEEEHIPRQLTARIATSSAQNDAGVFELSFGDARYLPFEGAGAVSKWRLRLPKLRSFDYAHIDDVLLHLAYSAEYDEDHRLTVENEIAAVVTKLRELPFTRVISFKRELGSALTRLMHSPLGTSVPFEITAERWPFFLRSQTVSVTAAHLALVARDGESAGVTLELDDTAISDWKLRIVAESGQNPPFGALPHSNVSGVFERPYGEHRLKLTSDVAYRAIDDLLLFLVVG